ncbi:glycine cleavage system aminomethyltransferase GcvT [Marivivens donghaensis]|uniref:aminomethyltransferase n=1 Tax=Marivivens donghaensis TaxID=1699413 RepID=A0ABX0VUH6_9RHOB|nr:glycine cleavage system aminomethyltransferase GcvT [Marivivens donghaensis]NIY71080.1 glycine cleavage system aminomethyltransferase GcvT [Marivivens donghaensis]
MSDMKRTGLFDLHLELGAKMVPFAGYDMPVQYPMGVMKEHLWTRENAGLFDVSHMGQVILRGDDVAAKFEALVPMNVQGLKEGRQRYGLFTNDDGGIRDDLMFANRGDHLFVVVNAACKDADIAYMRSALEGVDVIEVTDRSLVALQGPKAEAALQPIADVAAMKFMDVATIDTEFGELWISRSGYTGEDGFEISVPDQHAEAFARRLLADDAVAPIGLGARDSLRLEAGLCLYGSDIDEVTTPAAADLLWAIQKVRVTGERAGGFPGADLIIAEIENGAPSKRVGLLPEGRAPMRAGTRLFADAEGGEPIGVVTSGAFGPSIERPMSMAYVPTELAHNDVVIFGEVRGKRLPAKVTALPFRPSTYKR